MMALAWRFLADRRAATAIEYGLIAGIVGVGIVVGLGEFKVGLLALYDSIYEGFRKVL